MNVILLLAAVSTLSALVQALAIPDTQKTEKILPQESSLPWSFDFVPENIKYLLSGPAMQSVASSIPNLIELFKENVLRSGVMAEITSEAAESIKTSLEAYENFFTKLQIGFIDIFTSMIQLQTKTDNNDINFLQDVK